jgi:hypothetical protein
MTVHQALAELKVLDSRITKAIAGGKYMDVKRHCDKKIGGVDVGEYCTKTIRASYDSAIGLIARRNAIKRAVVKSNAVTTVDIGGTTYTVAEAIEMNNHGIDFEQQLYDEIRRQMMIAQSEINRNSGPYIQQKAENYINGLYGGKDKVDADSAKAQMQAYIDANSYELVDPLGIQDILAKMEADIASFTANVDAALSVSNAITKIEVEY